MVKNADAVGTTRLALVNLRNTQPFAKGATMLSQKSYKELIMFGRFIFVLIAVTFLSVFAAGQAIYEPEKGSAERTGILGALRVPVEKA